MGKECLHRVTSVAMSKALDRLTQGLPPTTDDIVGVPAPFSFSSLPPVAKLEGSDSEDDGVA